MKFTYALTLMTVLFVASSATAVDCSAQFSACIYQEASNNTTNGTDICIAQRTSCMGNVAANGNVVSLEGVSVDYPKFRKRVAGEHVQERQDLRAFGGEQRANLRDVQKDVRDTAVGKIDGLLKGQAQERQEERQSLRGDRKDLRGAQRTDTRGKLTYEP
jgi:hypothetical protein